MSGPGHADGDGTRGRLDAREILRILPHRYPMLLVDRVESCEPGRRLVAIKCVTANEPVFRGHFPDAPVFPGVLLVEAMAQAAGLLAYASAAAPPAGADATLALLGIDGARFRRPVVPGDRLEIVVETRQRRGTIWRVAAHVTVDGTRAAEAELLVGLVGSPTPRAPGAPEGPPPAP